MQSTVSSFYEEFLRFLVPSFLGVASFLVMGCKNQEKTHAKGTAKEVTPKRQVSKDSTRPSIVPKEYIANAFDFPVGKPDAKGYYNAQAFGENNHLGDDWNAVTGGNSDLGKPIYAIANGQVVFAEDIGGGWGKVVRIVHTLPDEQLVESVYAHCDTLLISEGTWVEKGFQIGTIGTAGGQYLAHLHLEIRDMIQMPMGGGYGEVQSGYLDPSLFIQNNREVY